MFGIEFFGNFNINGDDVRAAVVGTLVRRAQAGKFEVGAGLGASGDFHGDLAVDRLYYDLGAKSSIDHWDGFFGKDDVTFAGEIFVSANPDLDIKVATLAAVRSGAAFASNADGLTIENASGDFELN